MSEWVSACLSYQPPQNCTFARSLFSTLSGMRCKQHIIISANGGNTFRLQPLSINSFLNLRFYASELGLGLVRKIAAGCIIGHAALVFEKNHPLSDQIELKEFDTRQLIMISARGILQLLNKHAPNITTMKLAQWEKTHVLLTSIVKMCHDGAFCHSYRNLEWEHEKGQYPDTEPR